MKWLTPALRILIALIFIISAIAKLLSADAFEVYLYQLGIFSFDWSAWLARLLISFELIIGIGFITRFRYQTIWWLAMLSLAIFSSYLMIRVFQGSVSDCFCFGELMSMTPRESLLKNLLLVLLMLLVRKTDSREIRLWRRVFISSAVVALVLPAIISPPDNLLPGRISLAEMDRQSLTGAFNSGTIPSELKQGKKLVCFYSTSCKFCQLSSSRVSSAFRRNELPVDRMHVIFLGSDTAAVVNFKLETNALDSRHSFISAQSFLSITKGRMPLIILMEDGEIKEVWNYRQFKEDDMVRFLESSSAE